METAELLKKVRRLEIKTRGLSKNIFAGEYHSAFKGRGMTFSEVREYQPGDDIRSIDWKITARFNHPYVKLFEEERELTIMLLIDVSGSQLVGSQVQLKKEMITEIAAVLAFSAIQNNDKIGVAFFTDQVEKFIPPGKGKKHVLRIIRELIEFKPANSKTNLAEVLKFTTNAIKKRCTTFVLSDFNDTGFEDALKIAKNKHDIIAIKIFDERENQLPDVGLVRYTHAETGAMGWLDTSDKKTRQLWEGTTTANDKKLKEMFSSNNIDNVKISTNQSYIAPLRSLFKHR